MIVCTPLPLLLPLPLHHCHTMSHLASPVNAVMNLLEEVLFPAPSGTAGEGFGAGAHTRTHARTHARTHLLESLMVVAYVDSVISRSGLQRSIQAALKWVRVGEGREGRGGEGEGLWSLF